ncbi:hypothetical protein QBC47DRAFT_96388 [Echria macrotheca]|uniref:Uncharacterized protein n=1 Tax=Echria macrotheca TaxID=438768 RepID=A0AAJ0F894_9PEZI|nr:hypothetical protein QBC47DRAFT_96388 [Echria macrotheca]
MKRFIGTIRGRQDDPIARRGAAPRAPVRSGHYSPGELERMTVEELVRLGPSQLENVPPAILERLPLHVLSTLPSRVLEGLSSAKLEQLPPEVLKDLSLQTLAGLSPKCLSKGIPIDTLRQLPRETLLVLPRDITKQIFNNDDHSVPHEPVVAEPHVQAPFQQPVRFSTYDTAPAVDNYHDIQGNSVPDRSFNTAQQHHDVPMHNGRFHNRPPLRSTDAGEVAEAGQPGLRRKHSDILEIPPIPPAKTSNRLSLQATPSQLGTERSLSRNERRVSEPNPSQPRRARSSADFGGRAVLERGGNKAVPGLSVPREVDESLYAPQHPASAPPMEQSFSPLDQPKKSRGMAPDAVFQHGRSASSSDADSGFAERSRQDSERQTLHNKLAQARNDLDAAKMKLAQQHQQASATMEQLGRTNQQLADLKKEAETAAKATSSLQKEVDDRKASELRLRTTISSLEKRMREQDVAHSKYLEGFERQHEQTLLETRNKHQAEIDRKTSEHARELATLQAQHQEQMKTLEKNVVQQKSLAEQEGQDAEGRLTALRRELTKTKGKWNAQVEDLQRRLQQTKAEHEDELRKLRQAHSDEMAQVAAETSKLKKDIERLRQARSASQQDHNASKQAVLQEKAELETKLARELESYKAEITRVSRERDAALQRGDAEHRGRLESLIATHRAEVGQLQNVIRREREEHRRALTAYRVSNAETTNQPAEADLTKKFTDLKLAVEMVTAPFNLGRLSKVRIPRGSRLDPTRFLERESNVQGATGFLLQSAVWGLVVDGFFSAPCGFGAFGAAGGKALLMELFDAWLRLFSRGSNGDTGPLPEEPDLECFKTDKEANKWRSATFHSILSSMLRRARQPPAEGDDSQPGLLTPYAANQNRVREGILDILREVTNGQLLEDIEDEVGKIARLGAELALEVGVHRGFIEIRLPERGSIVEIGSHYVDCHDGDAARGTEEQVDLAICPRFSMTADGSRREKTMHPARIYPRRH